MYPDALRAYARLAAAAGEGEPDDSRRFSFVCSTSTKDLNGRIVTQDWELEDFEKNPIVLWNHGQGGGFWGELEIDEYFPIGRAENVRVEGGKLLADIVIASVFASPLAERIYHALKEQVLNAVSVGWDPRERRYEKHDDEEVLVLAGNRLVEISIVPFPANPDAVRAHFCARARAGLHQQKGSTMAFLALMAGLFGLAATATEEQVAARGRELTDFEKAMRDATGASDGASARASVLALGEKARGYDALALAKAEGEKSAKKVRIEGIIKAGRAAGKLTPANEPGLLEALCGDKTGEKAEPASLELLVANLPVVVNLAHSQTPADKTEATVLASPTPGEIKRAKKIGVEPQDLANERVKLQRERAGIGQDDDNDEEG